MYIDFSIFWEITRLTFSQKWFSPRRTLWYLLFTLVYFPMIAVNVIGAAVDEIFFRGYRKQKVKSPIFIIAPPRSGTTFLHNLMIQDRGRYTCYRLYQTLFPQVSLYRFIDLVLRIDRRAGGLLRRFLKWFEKKAFGGWKNIHTMGFNRPEEDECLSFYTLLTPTILLAFPYMNELKKLYFLDNLPFEKRRALMRFYERSVKKHLYALGGSGTFITKNVFASGRVRSIRENFPDARFIHVIRHPYQVVPSLINMFSKPWKIHSPDIDSDAPEYRAWGKLAVAYFKNILAVSRELPGDVFSLVYYDDLTEKPKGVVENIYRSFGIPVTPEFAQSLARSEERAKNYNSRHEYDLDEFGLTESKIYEDLKEVFVSFGFEQ